MLNLETDGAAVVQVPSACIILEDIADQLVLVVLELLLQHDPELGRLVRLGHVFQLLDKPRQENNEGFEDCFGKMV